jgi:hypothetical protein
LDANRELPSEEMVEEEEEEEAVEGATFEAFFCWCVVTHERHGLQRRKTTRWVICFHVYNSTSLEAVIYVFIQTTAHK